MCFLRLSICYRSYIFHSCIFSAPGFKKTTECRLCDEEQARMPAGSELQTELFSMEQSAAENQDSWAVLWSAEK